MKGLAEKVSYLKGLAEGMELESTSKEGKVITKMIGLLEDMAEEFRIVNLHQEEAVDYLEALDEDLADLEMEVYEEDEDDDEYDFDDELIEVQCPNCGETIFFDDDYLDEEDIDDEVPCPNCGETICFDNDDIVEDYEDDESDK